jgi:RHS repeat-associated protein
VTSAKAYSWTLTVSAGGSNLSASGTTYAVPLDGGPFGAGWSFAALDQLYPITGGVLRAYGTGEWRFYSGSGPTFTSPAGDVGTLTLSGGVYTYQTPDGQKWTFNSSGYETGWSSPDGLSLLTFTYSGSQLSTMQAIDGTATTFSYASGRVTSIVTGNGRTTSLAYDTATHPNLTQVTNPDGGLHTFAYDAGNRVTGETFANLNNEWAYSGGALATITWGSASSPSTTALVPAYLQGLSAAARGPAAAVQTDALGDVTTLQLDGQGRALKQVAPDGGTTAWGRDANGFPTAVTDPLGRTTSYAYDGSEYVTLQTNPDGSTRSYAYQSAFHALISATDERGFTGTFAYDSGGHQTSTTDALGNRVTSTYLTNGLLQSTTDPRGNTTTYNYDTLRRLTTTADALNEVTSYGYDTNGFEQTVTDALGRVTTALNDVMGRTTGTIDALGDRGTVTYNAAGEQLTSTDQLGRQTSTIYDSYNRGLVAEALSAVGTAAQEDTLQSYDALGRVSQAREADGWWTTDGYNRDGEETGTTDALGDTTRTNYDLDGEVTASRDALGRWSSSAYTARGWLKTGTDAQNNVTSYGYDPAGDQTTVTDPLGHVVSTAYDALNRATVNTDALGHSVTTTFDKAGNVSTVTDARGNVTSYAYDALDRATMTTVAVGTAAQATTSVAFDKDGNATSTTDQLGHVTSYGYDADNRQTTQTDQLGHTVSTAYDAAGNATTTTDAQGDVTSYGYDALNRNTLTTDSNGHTTTTIYDADGAAVGSIDGAGDVTRSADNALGEQVGSVDGDGKVTQDGYDPAGQQTFLTDPDGNQTQWVYDTLGRQAREIDPFGHAATTLYDTAGRVTSVTDQLGRAITYAYDAVNRLIGETWKSAAGATTNVQTFTYDNNGNQLTAADDSGTYTMGYDAQDRMTAQTGPFGVALTYAYDAAGRQTTLQDSQGGVLTSVYDNASRLQTREFGGAGQTPLRMDLNYDNADRLTGLTRYSNLAGTALVGTSSYGYDAASRMTSIVSKNASLATVSSYNYSYDNADRVTVQSGTGATGTYSYDAASQVTSDGTKTYGYDNNGNRNMSGYQTGTDNQTTNDGTYTYTYDAVGNLTGKSNSGATWAYGYDNQNHLKTVQETVSGSTALAVTYTYDVFGQRIEEDKWTSGTGTATTRFVWSGTQVIMDMNGSNVVQERYLWGDTQDQLFARIDGNGTAWWYLTDREESVRDVLNASGVSQDHTDYTAFGVIITQTSAAAQGRFAFTGDDFDPQTGLQYNRRRYYAPSLGIFISTDPIQFDGGLTTLYGYCGNDPTNVTDPSGTTGWFTEFATPMKTKFVHLYVTFFSDSDGRVDTRKNKFAKEFERAKRIYERQNIKLKIENKDDNPEVISRDNTWRRLGQSFSWHLPESGKYEPKDQRAFKDVKMKPGVIYVYYVESIGGEKGPEGFAYTPDVYMYSHPEKGERKLLPEEGRPPGPAIVIATEAASMLGTRTLAHELGHVLLDDPNHSDIGDDPKKVLPPEYLMSPSGEGEKWTPKELDRLKEDRNKLLRDD